MKKIFVTTFNKKLFDKYAHKLLDSYVKTKQIFPLYCYVEDDVKLYPNYNNVHFLNLFQKQPECKKFVDRNFEKNKKYANLYLLDAVRFCYKVFAQSDARNHGDHIFYIDADTYFQKTIPSKWYELCLPENVFISFYDRLGYYTEAGFIAFNGSLMINNNKLINYFFDIYTSYYTKDLIYSLPAFTDCHALDATRYRFLFLKPYINEYKLYNEKKLGDIRLWFTKGNLDVMKTDQFINQYIVHNKGLEKMNNN